MDSNNSTNDERAAIYEDVPLSLDQEAFSIRLIKVLPDLCDEEIQCAIYTTTLNEAKLQYTCLSYVWNPPTLKWEEGTQKTSQQRYVRHNGERFAVGQNLYDFLETARVLYPNRPFWIDAISIDQSSVPELNHQVQRMGEIYSHAEDVIAWFGKNADLAQVFASLQERFVINVNHKRKYGWSHKTPHIHKSNISPILWQDNYWTRAWITQEIICARHLTLLAGMSTLDWDYFPKTKPYSNQVDGLGDFEQAVIFPDTYRSKGLLLNLHWFGNKSCARKHDRVYSLLAICDPNEGSHIKVDYGVSRWELALQVLRSNIVSLCLCSIRRVAQLLELGSSQHKDDEAKCPWTELALDIIVREKLATHESPVHGSINEESASEHSVSEEEEPPFGGWPSRRQLPEMWPDKDWQRATAYYGRQDRRAKRAATLQRRRDDREAVIFAKADHIDRLKRSTHAICLSEICEKFSNHVNLYQTHKEKKQTQTAYRENCKTSTNSTLRSRGSSWVQGGQERDYGKIELKNSHGIQVLQDSERSSTTWSFNFDSILEILFQDKKVGTALCSRALKGQHDGSSSMMLRTLSQNKK